MLLCLSFFFFIYNSQNKLNSKVFITIEPFECLYIIDLTHEVISKVYKNNKFSKHLINKI